MIPPNINVTTYYDDTTFPISSSPITWHTSPETHIKVISYTGPNHLSGMTAVPPCFRVFLPNGIMEEFGCTPDSLQFYPEPSGANTGLDYIANWYLDLITDRHGNQIHVTYQSDMATGVNNISYPRDTVLATIEYNSPNCHDSQDACTGSAWAPLMRVNFVATHAPARFYPSTGPSGVCNTGTNLRCDDAKDETSSGGPAAPTVQSTFALNDLQVQVRSSGTAGWNTLRDYQLSYEQSGPGLITDATSGQLESTAGMFDLTQITIVGDNGTTALPTRTFSSTSMTQHYEDSAYHAAPAGNCGPSWNTGCLLWSQSYDGNSRYLASASNGLGLEQDFAWNEARNNTHGVNGGGSNTANPLYCDGIEGQGYPCNEADDQEWSHIALQNEDAGVVLLTQDGQGGSLTNTPIFKVTSYTYQLTYPLVAQACSDCVAGMYWGNQNNADYLDYYDSKFMGFAQTTFTHEDNSVEVHKYYSTEGVGLYCCVPPWC